MNAIFAHIQVHPPIELPARSRACFTPEVLVTAILRGHHVIVVVVAPKFGASTSEGFDDLPLSQATREVDVVAGGRPVPGPTGRTPGGQPGARSGTVIQLHPLAGGLDGDVMKHGFRQDFSPVLKRKSRTIQLPSCGAGKHGRGQGGERGRSRCRPGDQFVRLIFVVILLFVWFRLAGGSPAAGRASSPAMPTANVRRGHRGRRTAWSRRSRSRRSRTIAPMLPVSVDADRHAIRHRDPVRCAAAR